MQWNDGSRGQLIASILEWPRAYWYRIRVGAGTIAFGTRYAREETMRDRRADAIRAMGNPFGAVARRVRGRGWTNADGQRWGTVAGRRRSRGNVSVFETVTVF